MLNLFVKLAKRINEEVDYIWLVENLRKVLPNELDFNVEKDNILRFRGMFKDDRRITTPEVYTSLSNSKLIVMEFVDGINIDNVEELRANGFDTLKISRILSECYSKQIFSYGIVHADPHAGNIFVRRGLLNSAQLVFLDHGI
jgi:ubiquinone biosynthesis protein